MATFAVPDITNVERLTKELDEVLDAAHEAYLKGDIAGVQSHFHFPCLEVTDHGSKNALAAIWGKDEHAKFQERVGEAAPKEFLEGYRNHKRIRRYTFLSDAIALSINDDGGSWSGKDHKWKSCALLIKQDGKWYVKAEIVGGWGDVADALGMTR